MTASQIIHEIELLPLAEQAKVVRFTRSLETKQGLAPGELTALAERLAKTSEPGEAAMLREEIVASFYGGKAHA